MKKRTCIPYYSKARQRLEKLASDARKAGDKQLAAYLLDQGEGDTARRQQASLRRIAQRMGAE